MEENKRLSDLFESARTEAPKTSFEEVTKHVIAASAVGGTTGIIAKIAASSFKVKAIIMVATLSTLTISTLLIIQLNSGKETIVQKSNVGEEKYEQTKEISRENGIQKTVLFDKNNQVVEVIVDSSNKVDKESEEFNFNTLPLLSLEESDQNLIETRQILPRIPKTDTEPSKESEPVKEQRFEITEKTTEAELERISKLAEAAGIQMKYKARIKKNIITKLTMSWELDCEDGESNWNLSVSGDDDFSIEVGWEENENGKATSFLSDKQIEMIDMRLEILEEIEEIEEIEED